MTAAAVAAGLFPPSSEQTWNSELNWYLQANNESFLALFSELLIVIPCLSTHFR